ncbi:MAG TPA: DUF3857 domain-containing protein [Terriglobales bacterium]|nr:DUF3857 domain-containing protein [Terriglobales bacterium]
MELFCSRKCNVWLVVLFLVFAGRGLVAADWPPITPEEQAMTSVPGQPGAPAVILLRQETDDDMLHYHSVVMRIKILTEAGRKYADVEIPYNRHRSGIAAVSGRTVHADGSIVTMQGKPLDKVVVKAHGLRIYEKSFNLPDAQVGSILDYRYEYRYADQWLFPPEWIVQSDLFEKKVMFKFVPYNKEWEHNGHEGQGVAWTHFLPKPHEPVLHKPIQNSLGNSSADWVDLEMDDVPAFVEEPYMPPPDELKWRVEFYYRTGYKPDEFWKEEGKDWNKEVDSFLGRKKGVEEATAQIVNGAATPEDKVKKIYYFVSRLENQSYDPPRGAEEAHTLGIKANRGVEDVLQQKSGDHDELNRLFVAMVRAAGLQAWLMRVPDRSQNFFEPQFLSSDQFDGEVAIVQLDGKDVDLDPGTKFCPYGLLNWRYSGDQGQRQSAGKGTELSTSTMSNYNDAMVQRLARLQLTDHGAVEGTLVVGFYGIEAMIRRQEGGHTDDAGRKKLLEDEIRSWLPGGSEVTLIENPLWPNTELPLIAKFKISSPLAASAGKRWIIPVHVLQVNDKALFSASSRENPIYFDYPYREVDEVHITIPPGMQFESLPSGEEDRLKYAVYSTQLKQETPDTIMAVRQVALATALFGAGEYKDVKGFYDKVKAGDDQQAILKAVVHVAGN